MSTDYGPLEKVRARDLFDGRREHAVRVTLTPEKIAAAVMSVTHEDDLPSA